MGGWKRNIGIQVLWDLMTIAKQPGETVASALKPSHMDECLKLFNIKISNGPIYVCTVCLQTWFGRSVSNVEFVKVSSEAEQEKLNQCRRHYVSTEDKEWIHKTC